MFLAYTLDIQEYNCQGTDQNTVGNSVNITLCVYIYFANRKTLLLLRSFFLQEECASYCTRLVIISSEVENKEITDFLHQSKQIVGINEGK